MSYRALLTVALAWALSASAQKASPADWPQWRYDARRSAASGQRLPAKLHLQWVRRYPRLRPAFWQARQGRLQFDLGYEPVVAGKTLLVGSSSNDRLTALDTETGAERWRFYADGPVRLAPAVRRGKVYFASDDGRLYCLDATSGAMLWRRRGGPSGRKVLGNGRLISVWPARGGPVMVGATVCFAAGVWPFEGVFVYALDAEAGKVLWRNDRCGCLYAKHPHSAMAFGGPSPQGYLLVHKGELVVPGGRAFPAYFNLRTGKLASFEFGHAGHGSLPGSWFVAVGPDGELCVDPEINTEIHDAGRQIVGQKGIRRKPGERLQERVTVGAKSYRVRGGVRETISVGGRVYRFGDGSPGVPGKVHTMLAADGKLFVVTREGSIYCFGPSRAQPRTYEIATQPLDRPSDVWRDKAKRILDLARVKAGYALAWGLGTGRLVEELALQSDLHLIAVDPDARKVDAFRRRLDRAGLYGTRVAAHVGEPPVFEFPPYLASLMVSEDPAAAGLASGKAFVKRVFRALRPYGGAACLEIPADRHDALARWATDARLAGARVKRNGAFSVLTRAGPLPGAADYSGRRNYDQRVRAPLGLLWFGDTFHHHKLFYKEFRHEGGRGLPQTIAVVDGVMRYVATEAPYGPNPPDVPYRDYLRALEKQKVYGDAYTDVYTGRVLSKAEVKGVDFARAARPGAEGRDRRAEVPPKRTNPLTGLEEGREFLKTYGCDQRAVDYGYILTMRSGTAAYYDKRLESGTVGISGVRSGCRNTIIPAGGVLCLPSWTGNCTCNYPVFTSLALVSMPQTYEQWSAWGDVAAGGPVRRVGINLGAPGDRAAEDGTLWLDYPSVGGPSPRVPIRTAPETPEPYYRHASWMRGGRGRPWVTASGLKGIQALRIEPVVRRFTPPGGAFSVRWTGSVEAESSETYTFHARSDQGVRLWVAGKLVLDSANALRRGRRGEVSGSVALKAGARHKIKMEYYQPKPGKKPPHAMAELRWAGASTPKRVIPKDRFRTADGRPGGLTAAYYRTADLSGPAVMRVDPQIRFDWGPGLPVVLRPPPRPIQPYARYTVRLYFAEPEDLKAAARVFSVALQGREVLSDFDIAREARGPMRGVVKEFKAIPVRKDLAVSFTPRRGEPLLCGLELVAEGIDVPKSNPSTDVLRDAAAGKERPCP